MKENNMKKLSLFITVVIIGIVVWFLIIFPLLKFKTMEKQLLNATKRYYEINESKLPRGNQVKKTTLDVLYKQDFINNDLKAPYTNKMCDSENSWGKVTRKNEDYQYSVYLDCGIFKSKVDHKGPTIKLKGEETVTIYLNQKYEDAGVSSVVDDTDGTIDVKKVKIDTSKVDTSKVGTYEVIYTIKDSLDNETTKTRKIIVTQTLNNIVKTNTSNKNIYTGSVDNNYVMLDGIQFRIVGINSDGTVKIVSSDSLGAVNYEGIDSWLNDYFYNKLSESAKNLISQNSKWCIDKVDDPTNYKKCNKYSKSKPVGLLSVADYNNSKDNEGINGLGDLVPNWTSNYNTKDNYYISSNNKYEIFNKYEIYSVRPTLNILKDAKIVSGNGTNINPYILKGNNNKNKKGSKISSVKTGTYISYSGYIWRVIGKEDDDTTKVIMMDTVIGNNGSAYETEYSKTINYYNPNIKYTLAYNINNEITSYVNTSYFAKKNIKINQYNDRILYQKETNSKKYNVKLSEVSLFDLYSPQQLSTEDSWYQEISKNKKNYYFYRNVIGPTKNKYNSEQKLAVRLVGYLDKDVAIRDGEGTMNEPYTLIK